MEYRNRLCDFLDLVENNKDCVVLTLKPDVSPIDLIKLGGFDGRERTVRMSKDPTSPFITIFRDGGDSYHMNCVASVTLVGEDRKRVRDLVMECINFDFGIFTHGGPESDFDSLVAETSGKRDLNSRRRFRLERGANHSTLTVNNQHITSNIDNSKLETWLADRNACLFVRNTDCSSIVEVDTGTVERVFLPELERAKHLSNDQKQFAQALDKAADAFIAKTDWSGLDAQTTVREFVRFAKQQDLSRSASLDETINKAKVQALEKNITHQHRECSHKPPELGL